MTPSWGMTGSR